MKRHAVHDLAFIRAQCLTDAAYATAIWAMREAAMDQAARELRLHHKLPPRLSVVARRPEGGNVIAIPIHREGQKR